MQQLYINSTYVHILNKRDGKVHKTNMSSDDVLSTREYKWKFNLIHCPILLAVHILAIYGFYVRCTVVCHILVIRKYFFF